MPGPARLLPILRQHVQLLADPCERFQLRPRSHTGHTNRPARAPTTDQSLPGLHESVTLSPLCPPFALSRLMMPNGHLMEGTGSGGLLLVENETYRSRGSEFSLVVTFLPPPRFLWQEKTVNSRMLWFPENNFFFFAKGHLAKTYLIQLPFNLSRFRQHFLAKIQRF